MSSTLSLYLSVCPSVSISVPVSGSLRSTAHKANVLFTASGTLVFSNADVFRLKPQVNRMKSGQDGRTDRRGWVGWLMCRWMDGQKDWWMDGLIHEQKEGCGRRQDWASGTQRYWRRDYWYQQAIRIHLTGEFCPGRSTWCKPHICPSHTLIHSHTHTHSSDDLRQFL